MEKNNYRITNIFHFLLCLCMASAGFAAEKLTTIKILLNGKPEARFGGFYEAQNKGLFTKYGLAVQLIPNDPATNVLQLLVERKADFAVASADDVVLFNARQLQQAKGQASTHWLTATFAVFQNSPLGILIHSKQQFRSIAEFFAKEGDLAVQTNFASTLFLERSFSSKKVKFVPYAGDLSAFLQNPDLSIAGNATQDALALLREGAQIEAFLVSDLGYNPYATVVVGSEDLVKNRPNVLKAMTQALTAGWQSYLANPEPSNKTMHAQNPYFALESFAKFSQAQKAFIENSETKAHGLGFMSEQRWEELLQKMQAAGMIKAADRAEAKKYFSW